VYNIIQQDISTALPSPQTSHLHFITGKPGHGKSYIVKAIISHARAFGKIAAIPGTTALCVSDVDAARTTHSLFGLPVVKDGSDYTSSIKPDSPHADYL
jgi:hypothetical protein